MSINKPFIIACIPAYNEEKTIAKVIIQAQKHVDKVIVCDDGSSDFTYEIAKRLGAEVIRHARRLGKGFALKDLFKKALELKADIAITLDADGQHDANEIPKLIKPILDGEAELIIGTRIIEPFKAPFYRRFGRKVLDKLTGYASLKSLKDTQSGFRAYSRKALELIKISESGFGVDSEILIKAKELKFRISEVPIKNIYFKQEKLKRNPIKHAMEVISSILHLVTQKHPIWLLGLPGLALSVIGLYGWVWVINRYSEVKQLAIGHALIYTIILLVGIFIAFTALILFAISTILKEKR
jgi:glycosyltransferase involved in cell wall biosynthesis